MPLVPRHIQDLESYKPGKNHSEVIDNIKSNRTIKLASNENPLGCSPKSINKLDNHINNCNRYPDSSGFVASGQYSCSPCRTSHLEDGT